MSKYGSWICRSHQGYYDLVRALGGGMRIPRKTKKALGKCLRHIDIERHERARLQSLEQWALRQRLDRIRNSRNPS
jgi:hypothetical protein